MKGHIRYLDKRETPNVRHPRDHVDALELEQATKMRDLNRNERRALERLTRPARRSA